MRSVLAWLFVGLSGLASIGCSRMAASNVIVDSPKHYIVVLDTSASRTGDLLSRDQEFVKQVVNRLSFGDKLTLMEMQQVGLADHNRPLTVLMPKRQDQTFQSTRDKEALTSKQKGLLLVLPIFFKKASSDKALHTDIFSTMDLVGENERDTPGEKNVLVLLSDMLQSARGVEMSHASAMPAPNWISQQKHLGTLPHLSNTCVLVVGADDTDAAGAKVRRFWQQYFIATGANLNQGNYRFSPPEESAAVCN